MFGPVAAAGWSARRLFSELVHLFLFFRLLAFDETFLVEPGGGEATFPVVGGLHLETSKDFQDGTVFF